MQEKKLFIEIPGRRNDFHSAVLTSFSFNFHHFEFQVLRTLRQKWISNVAVLVDQAMLDGSIGFASGNLKQLSQSYSVNGIKAVGAFHPKINYLIGDNKLLMFFGSGNITPGGHGKNHELFTAFYADSLDSSQLSVLIEAWDYVQSLAKDISGYNKERITKQIASSSTLLRKVDIDRHAYHKIEKEIEVALLYNDKTSIFSQLIRLIPKGTIKRITIVCPYYDENGETLLSLANHFNNAEVDVYLPSEFGLPPIEMQFDKRINFFAWEDTTRGKEKIGGDITYIRKLHSKIFHFESEEYQYLILGSANATKAGLGTLNQRGINDEFCALYKSSTLDFLKVIGIKGKKRKVDVAKMERSAFIYDEDGSKQKAGRPFFITSVDLNGYSLAVYLKEPIKNDHFHIVIYNSFGEEAFRSEIPEGSDRVINLRLPSDVASNNLTYLEIRNQTGFTVSNKQPVNNVEKLFHTDPSKANRSINQVINGLETGTINEFEILSYLNDINLANDTPNDSHGKRLGNNEDQDEEPVIEMTYDEAVEASKNPDLKQRIIRTHNSIQLWESISRLLLDNIQRRNDELEDEEEEGSAETSNVRKSIELQAPLPPRKMKIEQLIGQVETLVDKYKKSVARVTHMANHKIDVMDLVQFLLVTHVVTALTYFNDGSAFKENSKDSQLKLRNTFKHQMKDILTYFNKLLVSQSIENSSDHSDRFLADRRKDYQAKAVYYFLLYIHLIDSLSSEQFIRDYLELLSFNMFNRLGITDSQYEQYMDDISRTEDDVKFNASAAIRLRNSLEEKFIGLDSNDNYFRIAHSGVCLIKEKNERNVRYDSIYGTNQIPAGKFKKY